MIDQQNSQDPAVRRAIAQAQAKTDLPNNSDLQPQSEPGYEARKRRDLGSDSELREKP